MKKQFAAQVWLLLLAVSLPVLSFAHSRTSSAPIMRMTEEVAPVSNPILTFEITSYTSTSISLAWTTSVPNLYFRLDGVNNSSTAVLPTVYTQAYNYTYTGLPPGNNFTFFLSCSYDSTGPYDDGSREVSGNSGIIVVDEVVYFENCTPQNQFTPQVDVPFSIDLQPSNATFPNINNHYIAEFEYNNATFRFACGFVPNNYAAYGAELSDPGNIFQLLEIDPTAARCVYNNQTIIFRLNTVGFSISGSTITATFFVPVSNFKFRNGGCRQGLHANRPPWLDDAPDRSAAAAINPAAPPYPNPFDTEAVVPYSLAADGPVYITLQDALGRTVQVVENTNLQKAGLYQARVDGAGLTSGLYYLQIQTGSDCRVHPLLKRE